MDYDNDAFQDHNHRLSGEKSSNPPPVLRPYDLPKFDFDDNLQTQLGFDTLVENEVFLEISTQEDNNWIEDISRGSSGIEFTSSATESCSISRRNNVWFEATSSESVEMLLKAVGQEEGVLGEAVIEESYAGNELGRLAKEMEPILKQDNKVDKNILPQPALPDGQEDSTLADHSNVVSTSEAQSDDPPFCGISGEIKSIPVGVVVVNEENLEPDRKYDDADRMEVKNSINQSPTDKAKEPSSVSDEIESNPVGVVVVNEENLEPDRKCDDADRMEVENSINQSPTDNAKEPSSISGEIESNPVGVVVVNEENLKPDRKCDDADRMEVENSINQSPTDNTKEPFSVSGEIESNPVGVVVVNEENLEPDRKCDDADRMEVENLINQSPTDNAKEPSSISGEIESNHVGVVVVNEENLEPDRKCDDADRMEVENSINQSPTDNTKEPSSVSRVHLEIVNIENASSVSQNVIVNSGEMKDQEKRDQVTDVFAESVDALLVDNPEGVVESKESTMVDEILSGNTEKTSAGEVEYPHCVDTRVESLIEKKDEVYTTTSQEPSESPIKVDSHIHLRKEYGNAMASIEFSQHFNAVVCSEVREPLLGDSPAVCQGDRSPNEKVVEAKDTEAVPSATPELEMGSVEDSKCLGNQVASLESQNIDICNNEVETSSRPEMEMDSEVDESVKLKDKDINSPEGVKSKVVGLLHFDECSADCAVNVIKPDGSEFSDTKEQAEEVNFVEQASPEVGVNSVNDDRTSAAETEGRGDTDLSCLKKSFELATGLKPVNENASQSDQEATKAGKECSEKLELCSVSVISTTKLVDVTAAAEMDNNNDILMEINAKAALVEAPEAMSVSVAEPCLDQRRNDHEAIVASETQITEQIAPSTKDGLQASVALACPSIYGYDCMIEDGRDPVYSIEDNCEGQKLEIKETTHDSSQHIESADTDRTTISVPLHPGNEATGEPSSFTFDVCPSSAPYEGEDSGGRLSFPSIQVDKDLKGSPLTAKSAQMVPEVSRETPQAPLVIGGKAHVGVKVTPERKTRRASGKATVRSAKKGTGVKEVTSGSQSDKVDKSPVSTHTPRTGQPIQFKELKPCSDVARSGTKPLAFPPIPTSNLPDLNTSVPTAAYFQQAFTDLQQVQLRAQIFVYGSLIQDSAPDEACMISAFGQSGGGGNVWGPAWRACVERVLSRKSHASNMGTPIQSGGKASGQLEKHSALRNKVPPSPSGRASSKSISSPSVTPIIPLSSPLWNVSTPYDGLQSSGMPRGGPVGFHQPLNPLDSYQVCGTRNFVGHTSSWPSQSSTWITSPQTSASDANACISLLPNTEPVKPTPAKDSSVPGFPGMNIALLPTVPQDSSGTAVSTGTSQPDMSKVASIPRSAELKPRKRKKFLASEGSGHIPLLAFNQGASVWPPGVNSQFSPVPEIVSQKLLLPQFRTESVQTAAVSSLFSTSVAVTVDLSKPASSPSKFPEAVPPMFVGDQPNRVDQNLEKSIIPKETSSTVEEAKRYAETAAAHAATAVSHYHDIWSQLAKQKDPGVIDDVEAKLASSAVAITAATSVARAAAAAAMIASNVAVQAKLMADEVSFSSAFLDPTHSTSLSKATSSAILKRGDGSVYPSSIIAVAREAAKKRVEAASAASKHAENLDAIVKAAELAAEAVSQAGKILSVGGPLPLSELKKLAPVGSERSADIHIVDCDQPKAFSIDLFNFSTEEPKGGPSGVKSKKTGKVSSLKKEPSRAQRGCRASELAKTTGVVPEAEAGLRSVSAISDDAYANAAGPSIENGMKEGCLVEVFKDGGTFKAAWYSATILELKDGKAFLCYTDLQAEDGTGQLKEWVPLQGDYISMPTLRIVHSTTAIRFDGTSRKRKAAMMDYAWLVGDRVDVWMHDCWREGVVKEKSKNDETTFTIDIPALGDTSIARAWHLRPTLTWQDGKWTERSSPRQHSPSQENVPQEKRVKLGSPLEAKGKEIVSRGVDLVESREHEESKLLPISENEKEFNIGKNTVHENRQESRRTLRTGLQKKGSRVVIGVPKPGKKRKFMDVSKHFDSDQRRKNLKTDDSVKFARYMAPQVSGSRGWKNSSKIDLKEKQVAEDKAKVLRSGKPPIASGKTLPRKDNNLASTKFSRTATITDKISDDAISREENNTSQDNLMEFGSVSDSQDTSEGQTVVAPKKGSSSNVRIERHNKGKNVPSGGRMGKNNELQEKLVPEFVEPRRSNRTIQPTSRLLEGLQSSLSITKIPFSSSKSHRSQSRSKF